MNQANRSYRSLDARFACSGSTTLQLYTQLPHWKPPEQAYAFWQEHIATSAWFTPGSGECVTSILLNVRGLGLDTIGIAGFPSNRICSLLCMLVVRSYVHALYVVIKISPFSAKEPLLHCGDYDNLLANCRSPLNRMCHQEATGKRLWQMECVGALAMG
jgi:hypothetical protein